MSATKDAEIRRLEIALCEMEARAISAEQSLGLALAVLDGLREAAAEAVAEIGPRPTCTTEEVTLP